MTGKEITTKQVVLFPIAVEGNPFLRMGIVKKIHPKTITVDLIENTKPINTKYTNVYRMSSEPYIGTEYRIRNPHRCFIIDLAFVPDNVAKAIKGALK